MAELVTEATDQVTAPDGEEYRVWVMGEQRSDGLWYGWLEFHAVGAGHVLTTRDETSQMNRSALHRWAKALRPQYFNDALLRSKPLSNDTIIPGGTSSSSRIPPDARSGY
jgi:hypothetical protein